MAMMKEEKDRESSTRMPLRAAGLTGLSGSAVLPHQPARHWQPPIRAPGLQQQGEPNQPIPNPGDSAQAAAIPLPWAITFPIVLRSLSQDVSGSHRRATSSI